MLEVFRMKTRSRIVTIVSIGLLMCSLSACKLKPEEKETSAPESIEIVDGTETETEEKTETEPQTEPSSAETDAELETEPFDESFESGEEEEIEIMIPSETIEPMEVQESGEINIDDHQGGSF